MLGGRKKLEMKPQSWLSILGDFEIADGVLIFKGGVTELLDRQAGFQVGNFISDLEFGGGNISTTITFSDDLSSSAAGIILYYHPATGAFVEAQIGGASLISVQTFGGQTWITHASHGPSQQIEAKRPYHLQAQVTGSRVIVTLDNIRVIDTNLPFSLPRGQSGIWAMGPHDISFTGYDVETERPKLFVVMQFTEPFNDLYTDVIRPIGGEIGFEVIRADETSGPGIIIADIERRIIEAKAIIADITPNNPNVYWEVGYAHALKKPTILVAERSTQLPFDISPFRTIFYDNTIAGKSKIEDGLRGHFEAILSEWSAV